MVAGLRLDPRRHSLKRVRDRADSSQVITKTVQARVGRVRIALIAAIASLGAAMPASAVGATTIGETSAAAPVLCSSDFTWIQAATGSASPTYAAPPGSAVITSWSHHAAGGGYMLRLKTFRALGPNFYRVVGESVVEPLTAPGLHIFPTRISVEGGDLIGFRTRGGGLSACYQNGVVGDTIRNSDVGDPDPAIGDAVSFPFGISPSRLNLAATIEPDADHDGYGDETQDQCPSDATTQGPCPPANDTDPPTTTITKGPSNRTEKHKATFKFVSDEPGSTFECKIDKKPYKACSSPRKVRRLDDGRHKFRVRATDQAGNTGRAAKDKWTVD